MPSPPVSLWVVGDHECVMLIVEGRYEVHLRVEGRTMRLRTCPNESAARLLAAEWKASVAAT